MNDGQRWDSCARNHRKTPETKQKWRFKGANLGRSNIAKIKSAQFIGLMEVPT
jgi:hypothetical protein